MKKTRIGILGGTFNPVHCGHLRVGIEISERTGLDKIMLMPNYLPPHRDAPKVSAQDRLMMCCLAAKSNPLFTVSDIEIKQKKLSYTLYTCQQLVEQHPEASFSFITGSDSLVKSVWYRFDDVLVLIFPMPMSANRYYFFQLAGSLRHSWSNSTSLCAM